MENASKALIIAGAILLAILLISLGIMVFNQAQGTIKGAGMSEAQLSTFNKKFTKYEGKQKGSNIRNLVQEVMANNNGEEASTETMVTINVSVEGVNVSIPASPVVTLGTGTGTSPNFTNNFKNTITYTVSFGYLNGRVAVIVVT